MALVDLNSEVNAMTPATARLSLKIQKTHIRADKINSSILNTFEIVLANL